MNQSESLRSVRVDLADSSYDVGIGPGVLSGLGGLARSRCGADATRAFVVRDSNLPDAVVDASIESLEDAGFEVSAASAFASEEEKSLATVERLLVEVERAGLSRWDVVVALGGGIVGDVAGFVGASYRRGVRVIQCPTTLLSMVDASVGGKTGVNLEVDGALRKNMAGAFWQPVGVLADTSVLSSLDARVLRAGLGECLKHAMLCGATDAGLWAWTEENLGGILALDSRAVVELVARNVAVKAAVVSADEREESVDGAGRAALNLGHTFAHAIETLQKLSPTNEPGLSPLMHGEAVLYGLVAATAVSEATGRVGAGSTERVRGAIVGLGLSPRLRGLPDDDVLLERMGADKKVRGGRIRLVLPVDGGAVELARVDEPGVIATGWDAVRQA